MKLEVCIRLSQISCPLARDLRVMDYVIVCTNLSGRFGFKMFAVLLNVLFKQNKYFMTSKRSQRTPFIKRIEAKTDPSLTCLSFLLLISNIISTVFRTF